LEHVIWRDRGKFVKDYDLHVRIVDICLSAVMQSVQHLILSLDGELSWDITTTHVNSALHPFGSLNGVPALAGVKAGKSPLLGGR